MNSDNLKSLAKTACDSLLAFFLALIDAVADDDAPPVVTDPPQPPADDAPNDPNGDQPSDSPPPQDQGSADADAPPADADAPPAEAEGQGDAPVDLGTYTIVRVTDPAPEKDGSNAKVITVPDAYSVIACWPMNNPTLTEIDADHMRYADGHATGQSFVFAKSTTVFMGKGQVYPPLPAGSTSTPPQTGTGGTTQPPAPPAPVEPSPMPPVATGPAEPGTPKDPAKLKAVITFKDATQITFLGSDAKDLGDFVVPAYGINQRNLSVTSADGLWNVSFRPDRDNARVEAVVLYGDKDNPNPATFDQPYTFDLYYDGVQIAHVDVAKHFWLARWRWKSSPRPRMRTPAQIVAAKLSPAYTQSPVTSGRLPGAVVPYVPMDNSTITTFMGQTGERADIGLNPEHAACYMATEDATAYNSMMEWAEASATGPWHLNDTDGTIFNFDLHKTANLYSSASSVPPLYVSKIDTKYPRDFLRPDDAHHPCLSYIPFLSTGDPFHAEELQYQINFYLGGEHYDGSALDPARKAAGGKLFVFDGAQTRGYAWMGRSVLFSYLASGLISSPVLLPKAFWKKVLDANLKYCMDNFVNGTTAKETVFGSGTSKTAMGWWQEDYLCGVLGVIVHVAGLAEWQPVLDWKLKSNDGRLSSAYGGGLNPQVYYAQYVKQTVDDPDVVILPMSERGAQYPNLGTWRLRFTDPNTFEITDPAGKVRGTWPVGDKAVEIGNVPAFKIVVPHEVGKIINWTFSAIETWEDLWTVNSGMGIVRTSTDGKMVVQSNEYAGSLRAALAAAKSPLLADYDAKLLDAAGAVIPWRDSLAA